MPNQNLEWETTSTTPGFTLRNLSGVKVWLSKGRTNWILYIGDNDTEITGEKNRVTLPGHLSETLAKRVAIGRVSGYLQDLIRQLERFVR